MAISKRRGQKASAQDNFIGPNFVTGVTATDVGTNRAYNDGAIDVSWTNPSTGNTPTGYKIYDGATLKATVSHPTSTARITGLSSATSYTFTVKAYDSYGESTGVNAPATTATTVPQAPTIGTVTNSGSNRAYNNGLVTVGYTAGATGGKTVTTYTATASSGGYTGTGSSPINVSGLQSATSYTFTVTATNANGTSAASSASASVTATTVPNTPSAPSVSSTAVGGSAAQGSANTSNDTVSWSAPANGGSSITNYYWLSSDGKSGNTTSTSVVVSQESGTSQTYTVRADNANGSSIVSSPSASITSAFSFTPFSVFGFSPFGVFGFSPFGFSPFGFSPFGFSPFGFSPFGFSPFGFSPFSFAPNPSKSLFGDTKVRTPEGLVSAAALSVGDQVLSVVLPGLPESGWTPEDVIAWNLSNPQDLDLSNTVVTTVQEIVIGTADLLVFINGDGFSGSHGILVQRNETALFVRAKDILESDLIWSLVDSSWKPIESLEKHEAAHQVWSINTEPYDIFFTENMLVHDTRPDVIGPLI